ncbi:hypothetical protein [Paraburkholderia phosphatilytica]|uniref:hypothetical protein n=1 Tax=Paraburkholderia phosphatilytica TaxID=2282883 RepID=UPI000E47AC04|nr:hypothetical protein [Paraburkholderia phosphatilytica]
MGQLLSFTDQNRVDIRRWCGFPAYGGVPVQAFGWRFFQQYGTLEFRLTNMSDTEISTCQTVYMANLATLENAIPAASNNLDTDQAAVWKHNKNEVADRAQLFTYWAKRLCAFIGVQPGPYFDNGPGSLRIVV